MDEPGREDFEKFLLECFPPSGKRGTSGIFYQEFGEKVKEAIKDPCEDWYHVKCVGVEDTCGYWLCCNCQSKYSLCPHVYVLSLLTLFLENTNASSTYVSFEELKMSIAKTEV